MIPPDAGPRTADDRPHRSALRLLPRAVALALLPLALACASPVPRGKAAEEATPAQWQLDWVRDAVFYEVFVRSFADSDGDGVGDLAALTARLDYLNDGRPGRGDDLEVDALWLMPIFESPSYHGYDTVDYRAIDREYGSREDFSTLLEAAHRRGMRVIVDLMINHTSAQHPWFVESAEDPAGPRRPWYVWREDDPGWTQPWGGDRSTWHRRSEDEDWYYGIFWGGMPDLNFRHPPVRREVLAIMDHWLAAGVDGFRLDAARHIVADGPGEAQNDTPETLAWWREVSQHVREGHPDALLLGENWTDSENIALYYGDDSEVAGGDGLPMSFAFPVSEAILETVRRGDGSALAEALDAARRLYPEGALQATFLTNHDMTRVATQLADLPGAERLAASLLLTLPGTPFLYYGEEVGLLNGPGGRDEEKRTPLPWSPEAGVGFTTGEPWHPPSPGSRERAIQEQRREPRSLWNHYRDLMRVRRQEAALRRGEIELLEANEGLLVYRRHLPDEAVLVAHNLTEEERPFAAPADVELLYRSSASAQSAATEAAGDGELVLGGRESALWSYPPAGTSARSAGK